MKNHPRSVCVPTTATSEEPAARFHKQAGMTLVEVALSALILTFALVGVASALGSNATAVDSARGLTHANQFLEEVLDSMSAQPYDNLLTLNGNTIFNGDTRQQSLFSARIDVWQATVDLLQVRVTLRYLRTGNEITRVVSYRSRR